MNNNTINNILSITADPAVTILMNTSRSFPASNKDNINLKNLITEAEKRLSNEYGDEKSKIITKRLEDFSSELDFKHNLDSIVIFASENFFDFFTLPVSVKNKVIIDKKFSAKVMLRSILAEENFYIICLSRKRIRIITANNFGITNEINDGVFPMENDSYLESDDIRKAWASTNDNYAKEFYNKADKLLKGYYTNNPFPVILAGDVRNISYYKEISDNPGIITGFVEGNFDNKKPYEILDESQKVINNFLHSKQLKALKEIESADNDRKLLIDLNDIYRAVKDGKGFKLFVEKDYFQPAIINKNVLTLKNDPSENGVTDDVIYDIIEMIIKFGGRVVFMNPGQLKKYNKVALITRY